MGKVIIKWALLSLFGLLLFALLRLAEFFGAYDPSFTSLRFIDPLTLSVRNLKLILDQRGIGYENVFEKTELHKLVEGSGKVSEADATSAITASFYRPMEAVTDFVGQEHFFELVEDSKDSAWLILITPEDGPPLLSLRAWSDIVSRLSNLGIRAGTIDCSVRPMFCERRSFERAMLLLALPEGQRTKEQVALTAFPDFSRSKNRNTLMTRNLLEWITSQLTARVSPLTSMQQLEKQWLGRKLHEVEVIMIARKSQDPTPMFLSALSVKFNGRTRFWRINLDQDVTKNNVSGQLLNNFGIKLKCGVDLAPSVIFIDGPSKYSSPRIYGERSGEPLSYKAMELYLRTVTPEANDLFLMLLLLVQLTAPIAAVLCQGSIFKRILAAISTLFWTNLIFLLLCLPVIGLFSLHWMQSALAVLQRVTRVLARTVAADAIRRDLLSQALNPLTFCLTYCSFLLAVGLLERWRTGGVDAEEATPASAPAAASFLLPGGGVLSPSPFLTQYQPVLQHELDLENGMQVLLTSLSSPALWLPSTLPQPDYINQLPLWPFVAAECSTEVTEECSICLENYDEGVSVCGLPCAHVFHENCIMRWLLGSQHACPVCRWPPYKPKEKQQ